MLKKALKELSTHKRFASLIKKYGRPKLKRGNDPFKALVRSIVYQQLSTKAAATIYNRFLALFNNDGKHPTPAQILNTPITTLKSSGLSAQKCSYLHDLALKFTDGTIHASSLKTMNNEEVVAHLTQIRGIGEWSVHMFLIFTLNRLNVLPTGDLGVRKGFQIVYKLKTLPDKKTMLKKGAPWSNEASLASWYFWRVADEVKLKK